MNELTHASTIIALFAVIIVCGFIIAMPLLELSRSGAVLEPALPSLPPSVASDASTLETSN